MTSLKHPGYTVLVIPQSVGHIQRFALNHNRLRWLAWLVVGLVSVATTLLVHYVVILKQVQENATLRADHFELTTRLRAIRNEMDRINQSLLRMDEVASRIRAMTQLHDPLRNLNIEPRPMGASNAKMPDVLYAKGERTEFEDEAIDSKLAMRMLDARLATLSQQTAQTSEKMHHVGKYIQENDHTLLSTPSLYPTLSHLIISRFGLRTDPYTDNEVMHKGVDIGARVGALVVAPADGLVVFTGLRGEGYGNTLVIDHGFGVQTLYSHLLEFKVQPKARVQRGDAIALVGNSGRSNGAHLHYEVRVSGIPVDPELFLFD